MNQRKLGTEKENLAARFLTKQGVRIVDRNFACKMGEIDLIGFQDGYLVFFEVKYRKKDSYGFPQEAVSKYKKRKICLVSGYYLMLKGYAEQTKIRYDVISILGDKIRWDKNAFEYDGL